METYLLDANAILAYLGDEPGAENIKAIFDRADIDECLIFVHAANVYEIYYQFFRDKGETAALTLWDDIREMPLKILHTFDEDFVKTAGRIKASFKMSVADSFLLAQAQLLGAKVVTSDHHELDVVDKTGSIQFFWFR